MVSGRRLIYHPETGEHGARPAFLLTMPLFVCAPFALRRSRRVRVMPTIKIGQELFKLTGFSGSLSTIMEEPKALLAPVPSLLFPSIFNG